jgi:prophage antirepressor-like protein
MMPAADICNYGFGDQLVRVTTIDDGVWFVANDVCGALELANPRQVVSRLDDDEKGVLNVDTLGGPQEVATVSESGVYALIFTSRKSVAKQFRKWVTSEVLPSIRKTGLYDARGASADGADRADSDMPREFRVPKLGTDRDRDAIRVAVLMVREMKDLYGQKAGRQMWKRLGFPIPDVDLEPAPAASGEPAEQREGDLHLWSVSVGLKESKRDATHESELYQSYVRWCSRAEVKPMGPERFSRMMILLFGHEEHPEMIRCVIAKPRYSW